MQSNLEITSHCKRECSGTKGISRKVSHPQDPWPLCKVALLVQHVKDAVRPFWRRVLAQTWRAQRGLQDPAWKDDERKHADRMTPDITEFMILPGQQKIRRNPDTAEVAPQNWNSPDPQSLPKAEILPASGLTQRAAGQHKLARTHLRKLGTQLSPGQIISPAWPQLSTICGSLLLRDSGMRLC